LARPDDGVFERDVRRLQVASSRCVQTSSTDWAF
jgi:hypothetical protein